MTIVHPSAGHADIELADYTYCNAIRRDIRAELDTQGEVFMQVWWEPEDDGSGDGQKRRARRGAGTGEVSSWKQRLKSYLLWPVPERLQSFKGCCGACCIKVLHPESRFRSIWNVILALLIIYCGIAVPLEIAFEADMVKAMCLQPHDPYGPQTSRGECTPYLLWFW